MTICMKKICSLTLVWATSTLLVFGQQAQQKTTISLNDLAAFKNPGNTWSIAGNVFTDLEKPNVFKVEKGTGILVNQPTAKNNGTDLYTVEEFGDVTLELDYLVAKGANSGIYLQGNYEIQIEDSWAITVPTSASNGAIYSRWDDTKPEGEKGYNGFAPRQNVSKAPGLWQKVKIVFQAPKFDASGKKTSNARILSLELNGVLIHDNIELTGVTRGAAGQEKAKGSLRLQGDHGAVAYRNIRVSGVPAMNRPTRQDADPIYIEAPVNTMIRSFIDVMPNVRSVHAISVGGPQQVSFGYDLDNGTLLQGWHGGFVDATPMWDGRGNGTSKPLGSITRFTQKPVLAINKLASAQDKWIADTTNTGFRTKGYVMDDQERPEFKYNIYGANVTDAIKIMVNGQGLTRAITVANSSKDLYFLLANADSIEEVSKGLYLIDDKSYYLQFDAQTKPIIRTAEGGRKELIVELGSKLNYTILF